MGSIDMRGGQGGVNDFQLWRKKSEREHKEWQVPSKIWLYLTLSGIEVLYVPELWWLNVRGCWFMLSDFAVSWSNVARENSYRYILFSSFTDMNINGLPDFKWQKRVAFHNSSFRSKKDQKLMRNTNARFRMRKNRDIYSLYTYYVPSTAGSAKKRGAHSAAKISEDSKSSRWGTIAGVYFLPHPDLLQAITGIIELRINSMLLEKWWKIDSMLMEFEKWWSPF